LDSIIKPLEIARMTIDSSGADLAAIVNEAGLFAIRDGRIVIEQHDMIKAIQRIQFGMSYAGHVNLEELMATAFHEAGHAVVCYYRNRRDRIQVLTVVPTGGALGYLWRAKKDEIHCKNKEDYLVNIEVSLGGLCAETLTMETSTDGVSSDLRTVAGMAERMIRSFGMGSFKFNTNTAYGTSGWYQNDSPSGETQREIELEIKKVVDFCHENVTNLLRSKRAELEKIARALLEKETLYYKDIVNILDPSRSDADIDHELETMGERKMVGKLPVINFDTIPGLEKLLADREALSSASGSTTESAGTSSNSTTPGSTGSGGSTSSGSSGTSTGSGSATGNDPGSGGVPNNNRTPE
jgi:cell division protease FtsH